MDALIRPLEAGDKPAVTRLLDETVGAGFWGFDEPGEEIAFVAMAGVAGVSATVAGAILGRLEPGGDPDALTAFGGSEGGGAPAAGARERVLHVREVAVAPDFRRAGIARRLLESAEEEAGGRGAAAAYLFAWLPAGRPEPAAVPFYLAAGYTPRPDIPDFYAAGSVASGAICPYCGAPPCRCSARPFVKALPAG
jgi:GNAT superfamily N-acetyltransferase